MVPDPTFDDRLSRIEARIAGLFWRVAILIALGFANLWVTVDVLSRLPR